MAAGAFLIAWLVWAVGRMGHAFPSPLTLGVGGPIIKMLGLKLSTSSPDWIYWLGPLLAGTALAATGALLVADLDRPERFWKILARPQWKSWLAIGSFIILAYALLLVALLGLQLAGPAVRATAIWSALFHLAMPAAVMTAIYTAFLFAQAKGRDLWQSPMLPLHLLVQAIIAGACITAISAPVVHDTAGVSGLCDVILVAALVTHVFLILVGEIWTEHSSRAKQRAISLMVSGPYSGHFWGGAIVAGVAVPLALLVAQMSGVSLLPATLVEPMAALLALAGLLAYEHSFVMVGQSIRLS
jgi:formate-dependent nitrite reductase membrane component NrfD